MPYTINNNYIVFIFVCFIVIQQTFITTEHLLYSVQDIVLGVR